MSFLNAEEPNVVDLIVDFGLDLIWHPSLGMELGDNAQEDLQRLRRRRQDRSTSSCFEGTVIQGPNGTGRMDMFADRPMKEWVTDLCAGRQHRRRHRRLRLLGRHPGDGAQPERLHRPAVPQARAGRLPRAGLAGPSRACPSSTSPGCPAHPDWITQILVALATGRAGDIALDDLHRPQTFFKTFTQTGCTRVQFFEYKQSTTSFGEGTRTGCLFYEFGCRGPMTHSPCNRILWNRQSSKTRAGMPCLGCTEPEFPHFDLAPGTVFKTQKVCRRHPEGGARGHRPPDLHGARRRRPDRRPAVVQGGHVRRLTAPRSSPTQLARRREATP